MDQTPNEVLAGQPVSFLENLDQATRNKILYLHLAFLSEARQKHAGDSAVLVGLATMEGSCIAAIRQTNQTVAPRTNFLSQPPENRQTTPSL